jgi:hypothetical protein
LDTVVLTQSAYFICFLFSSLSYELILKIIALILLLFLTSIISCFESALFSLSTEETKSILSNKKLEFKKLNENQALLRTNLSISSLTTYFGSIIFLSILIENLTIFSNQSPTLNLTFKLLIIFVLILFFNVL